jgi:hypothetical protein
LDFGMELQGAEEGLKFELHGLDKGRMPGDTGAGESAMKGSLDWAAAGPGARTLYRPYMGAVPHGAWVLGENTGTKGSAMRSL